MNTEDYVSPRDHFNIKDFSRFSVRGDTVRGHNFIPSIEEHYTQRGTNNKLAYVFLKTCFYMVE